MDTSLNSSPPDGGDSTVAFRKRSNDGCSRKYRRRDDGSSSSDGSPERNQSPKPKTSTRDIRKVTEPVFAKKEDRRESDRILYGRGGNDSHRHDRYSRDDHYRSKHDEYNSHGRDAPRSSRSSRDGHHSDRRTVETEHSRSRNDSDRHSRDKYRSSGHINTGNERGEDLSSGRRHADPRLEDKEKDHVRGRDCLDEKRGSRWSFGDCHSQDDKKGHGDPEISKEKDVLVKSPRNRFGEKGTEDRGTHSKKMKGFISEKFTHGNTSEEKQTSSLKPALCTGNQGLTLQSHSKETENHGDVDSAKVAAMQAAELVNKNLVGTGYLTTDQKKKLLWGKKKSIATEEPAHRWDSALIGDRERQEKFNKLMSLRLRWCIIVGCEREYSKQRAESKRSTSREAKRITDGSREAIHCWIKEERRTHGRVRSLNLFGKLFLLLSPSFTVLTTIIYSMCVRIQFGWSRNIFLLQS